MRLRDIQNRRRLLRIARLEGERGRLDDGRRRRILEQSSEARRDWETVRTLNQLFTAIRPSAPDAAVRRALRHRARATAGAVALVVVAVVIGAVGRHLLAPAPAWIYLAPAAVGAVVLARSFPALIDVRPRSTGSDHRFCA